MVPVSRDERLTPPCSCPLLDEVTSALDAAVPRLPAVFHQEKHRRHPSPRLPVLVLVSLLFAPVHVVSPAPVVNWWTSLCLALSVPLSVCIVCLSLSCVRALSLSLCLCLSLQGNKSVAECCCSFVNCEGRREEKQERRVLFW